MVDKACLLELESSRQAGALLLSRGKERVIEVVDGKLDEFGALLQKWQQRLTLETVNIRKAYIDGKINIVLVVIPPEGQDYRLIIRRAPNGKVKTDTASGAGFENNWPPWGPGVTYRNDSVVNPLPAEFVQGPDFSVLPSFVRLDPVDGGPSGDSQFLYFSLYGGTFKFLSSPGNWELDTAFASAVPDEFADKIIKNTSQVGRGITGKPLDLSGRLGIKLYFYELLASLRLTLFDDHIGLGLAENSNGIFKLADVAFGPFNL